MEPVFHSTNILATLTIFFHTLLHIPLLIGLLLEKQMKLHLLTTQRLRQLVETALRKHLTTFALANMHFMTADNHPYVGSQRVTEAITQHILHLIHSYHEYTIPLYLLDVIMNR